MPTAALPTLLPESLRATEGLQAAPCAAIEAARDEGVVGVEPVVAADKGQAINGRGTQTDGWVRCIRMVRS